MSTALLEVFRVDPDLFERIRAQVEELDAEGARDDEEN